MWTKTLFVLVAIAAVVHADIYMHNPRGSNNRLSGNNADRENANRLFDSQNNERGGYNVGDSNAEATNNKGDGLGRLSYYKSSILRVEWTNQHGGNNPNVNTNVVLQYMCNDMSTSLWDVGAGNDLRDGDGTSDANAARVQTEADANRGRHEPYEFYTDCEARQRNLGLFLANQNIADDASATRTRQDNAGTQYGFECPEERDYYPYWHPAPWKDIAVLTSNTSLCQMYQTESQNVQVKSHCAGAPEANNADDCTEEAGTWTDEPAWGIAAPECIELAWSRDNHLGNSIGGEPLHYNWTLPDDITDGARCVLRIRYNISTDDYDGWNTFYEVDEDGDAITPITTNPNVNVLKGTGRAAGVELNVNTDQFGRTFQDRSHTFIVLDRPTDIDPAAKIYNLNVRGRRGNIVQVYPAVEYDFVPRELTITPNDYVHIAWTGSLSSPDGNGQGAASSDKSNMVCIHKPGDSVPLEHSDPACSLFPNFDDHVKFASAGKGADVDELLDDADATFDGGLIKPGDGAVGEYHALCTRNNHFSNRAQKVAITVVPAL